MPKHRALACACLLAVAATAGEGHAEKFSYTNAQLLYGGPFNDWYYGYNTENRRLTTVTLEHFGTWEYGDNYFFLDLTFGKFVNAEGANTGERARLYSEYTPRLSLSKIAGRDGPLLGPIKDILAAGQIGVGVGGFWAGLAGIGIDLALPESLVFGVNVFVRKDAFNRTTYQVTPFWELPFAIASLGFLFRGYADIAGTDKLGVDFNTQPQLLLDLGALFGAKDKVQAGCEFYVHINKKIHTYAPQAMVRWLF